MKMDLILETPGTRVGKRQGMLKISAPDQDKVEVPLREVESIILGKSVQITTQALKALSEYAVNIVYTSLGRPYGIYTPFANVGTVFTRRQQLLAFDDFRGLHVATQIVYASIENKRRLLKYFAKNRQKSNPKKHRRLNFAADHVKKMLTSLDTFKKSLQSGDTISKKRRQLMGIEGKAAAFYFRELGSLMPWEFKVLRRSRRPPRDPVNSLLSLGYTILQGHITTAIASAGLELYGGFLHSDRSGKPSLALDLMEEFRQPVIDRFVAKILHQGRLSKDHFSNSIHGFRLTSEGKQIFYSDLREEIQGFSEKEILLPNTITENKQNSVKVKTFEEITGMDEGKPAKSTNYKRKMIKQARKCANYLIGSSSTYEPYIMKW